MKHRKLNKRKFKDYINSLETKRKITHLTLHFLWRRKGNTWKDEESVNGLSEYYKSKGRRFAFNIAVNKNDIWLCKNISYVPSHSGINNKGSIDIECNAVIGHRKPNQSTWKTYIFVINQLMVKFSLEPKNLYFHGELDADAINCPDVSKEYLLKSLNKII